MEEITTLRAPHRFETILSSQCTKIENNLRNCFIGFNEKPPEHPEWLQDFVDLVCNNDGYVYYSNKLICDVLLKDIKLDELQLDIVFKAIRKVIDIKFKPFFILNNEEDSIIYLPYSLNSMEKIIKDNSKNEIGDRIRKNILDMYVDYNSNILEGDLVYYTYINPRDIPKSTKAIRTQIIQTMKCGNEFTKSKLITSFDRLLFNNTSSISKFYSIHRTKGGLYQLNIEKSKYYFNNGIITYSDNTWWFIANATSSSEFINLTKSNSNYDIKQGKTGTNDNDAPLEDEGDEVIIKQNEVETPSEENESVNESLVGGSKPDTIKNNILGDKQYEKHINFIWDNIMNKNDLLKDPDIEKLENNKDLTREHIAGIVEQHLHLETISWHMFRFIWNRFNKNSDINHIISDHLSKHVNYFSNSKIDKYISQTCIPNFKHNFVYTLTPYINPTTTNERLEKIKTVYPQLESKLICIPICMNSLFTDFGCLFNMDTLVINRYGIFVVNNNNENEHRISNLILSRTNLYVNDTDTTYMDMDYLYNIDTRSLNDNINKIKDVLIKPEKKETLNNIIKYLLKDFIQVSDKKNYSNFSILSSIRTSNHIDDIASSLACIKCLFCNLSDTFKKDAIKLIVKIINKQEYNAEDIVNFDNLIKNSLNELYSSGFEAKDSKICINNISNLLEYSNTNSEDISFNYLFHPIDFNLPDVIGLGFKNIFENYPKKQTINHNFIIRNNQDLGFIFMILIPSEYIFRTRLIIDDNRMSKYCLYLSNIMNKISSALTKYINSDLNPMYKKLINFLINNYDIEKDKIEYIIQDLTEEENDLLPDCIKYHNMPSVEFYSILISLIYELSDYLSTNKFPKLN